MRREYALCSVKPMYITSVVAMIRNYGLDFLMERFRRKFITERRKWIFFFRNKEQFVEVLTVQIVSLELGPSSVFLSQNHYKCHQNERYMPVSGNNIWRKRPSFSTGTNYS